MFLFYPSTRGVSNGGALFIGVGLIGVLGSRELLHVKEKLELLRINEKKKKNLEERELLPRDPLGRELLDIDALEETEVLTDDSI